MASSDVARAQMHELLQKLAAGTRLDHSSSGYLFADGSGEYPGSACPRNESQICRNRRRRCDDHPARREGRRQPADAGVKVTFDGESVTL